MGDVYEEEAEEALKEYLEAVENHDKLLVEYFLGGPLTPRKRSASGKPLTKESFRELEEAVAKIAGALKKWNKAIGIE